MIFRLNFLNFLIILCAHIITSCDSSGNKVPAKESKIVGGYLISINEAKYQISLRVRAREKSSGFGRGHICGGSVIAQRLILTAAHCVENYASKDLSVVMGSANRFMADPQQLQYNVQRIIKHQNYNSTTFANDIALLFINGYIPWNWTTVEAIHLSARATAKNSLCTISGWGDTGNGKLSMNLLAANVPIISYQQCYGSYGLIPLSMICAGYSEHGGIDACQGDSGGPLVCSGLLVGIVSWGDGCALANRPGVYTNVSAFNNWIVKANSSLNYTFYDSATSISLSIYLIVLIALRFLYLLK